jgi:hypothetical protein
MALGSARLRTAPTFAAIGAILVLGGLLRYRELFALPEVFRVDPEPGRRGPTIRIFRLDPVAG